MIANRVNVAGVEVDNLSETEAVAVVAALVEAGGPHYLCVINAAKAVAASRDARLRAVLKRAALVTADGMSVVWAARWLGKPLKERVTGIDLFARLVQEAARRGWSVFFFGAEDESVRGVVERFRREHATLRVAGWRNGYFKPSESAAIAEAIRRSGADVLFVAMGSPAQEYWIAEHMELTGARFAMGVGGSFDHLSGRKPRAPRWMQRTGLEWLHRLLREPRRLWRRYLLGNAQFIRLVVGQRRHRGGA
ncbi:MAG TPA: WecB/TagA/CpsF family glycosyltransferase [Blastocatellia bacterium]|nr:WecB/TagA/CpsF family glycosyltransferase [Blastocatellia bacterium]